MNIAMLMAWALFACAAVIIIQQVYILFQWRYAVNDERYILGLEIENQYYRAMFHDLPSRPLIEHVEEYHESG